MGGQGTHGWCRQRNSGMGRRIFLALARTGSDPRWLMLAVGSKRHSHKLFPRTHPHKSWGGKLMINIQVS
jgi:hypothetical protein